MNAEGRVVNFGVGKMQIQEVSKGRIDKTKVTTASDAWMPISERYFLNPGYWKRGQRTLFCVKRREC